MPVLTFFKEERLLFEHRLTSRRTVIGRSDQCDVALPGEEVSRLHCWVEQHGEKVVLVDRSKHGTFVKGQQVERRVLKVSDSFHVGGYRVLLREAERETEATVEVLPKRAHEFIFATNPECLVNRASVVVTSGIDKGRTVLCKRATMTIGSLGSDIVLRDPLLRKDHALIRISRGRPMIEPGRGPVFLDGQRIELTTPVYPDEEVCIGGTYFRLETQSVQEQPEAKVFGRMIGQSKRMQQVFGRLRLFAGHDFPVLITGESGTGKELAARGVHESSSRSARPFVALNCGAIPENLLESELFGHEKGAFSGANRRRDGAFHQADGGTLFLDELGDLSLSAQVKLLRVLENGEVRRVGSSTVEYPNVRIIAATNKSLTQLVTDNLFREDLLFRLEVLSITLPPLRQRREDIVPLARQLCKELHRECRLSAESESLLVSHDWPGNIRELRNVLTRGFVLGGLTIKPQDVELYATTAGIAPTFTVGEPDEKKYLQSLLKKHSGNRSAIAREIGVPRTTLLYKLKRLGLVETG